MSDDSLFLSILQRYFGYDSFRSIQLDIIRSIASGHDTLGLMPTGGGKSITFQVPALAMEGVCLVITPLISLMNDQVENLKARGIKAETINSNVSHNEMLKILDNAIYGAVKFLYVSPERLTQRLFLAKLYYMKLCFITVDEAHCISQWGYDFRPPYLHINEIRKKLPEVPVLALTATATPLVVQDIQDRLDFGKYATKGLSGSDGQEFKEPQVFKMSFRRENLSYVVRRTEDKESEMIHILQSVDGCAIVYTRNRAKTKALAETLRENGISASYYHAGLDYAIKMRHQQMWHDDQVRVMVATNAFGMGIDKPDVRMVIHADCPDSLEAYFQEAGRAGRDGKRSYAVLLYNGQDHKNLMTHTSTSFPPKEYIRKVYDQLAYFFELAVNSGEGARYEFREDVFCMKFKHFPTHLEAALSILQNAGYIHYETDPENRPRVMFLQSRDALYHLENLSKLEDDVIEALLRYYGSLFSDLTYIDEGIMAKRCGTDTEHIHVALKELGQRGVIRFVPGRNVPQITYLRQRIESERLRFSKDVYEVLQDRMAERISSVVRYAETQDTCRQKMLIEYFGENGAEDCEYCDVCIENRRLQKSSFRSNMDRIMSLLSDNQRHSMENILALGIPQEELSNVIETLRQEEKIAVEGAFISKI